MARAGMRLTVMSWLEKKILAALWTAWVAGGLASSAASSSAILSIGLSGENYSQTDCGPPE